MIWDKIPVPLYTYESDGLTIKSREMDWDFTGSPADAMYMVKQAIKNETGEDWTIQLSESLPATITISSQSTSFSLILIISPKNARQNGGLTKKQIPFISLNANMEHL